MFVLAANFGTKDAAWGSMIVNPEGEIILRLPRGRTALGVAELDLAPFQRGWVEIRRQNAKRAARGMFVPLTQARANRFA